MASITPFKQPLVPSFGPEIISGQGDSGNSSGYDVFAEDAFEVSGKHSSQVAPSTDDDIMRIKERWWMPAWVLMECLILGAAVLLLLSGGL